MVDEGKWLSKAELKKKQARDAKRAELIAAGRIRPEDLSDDDDEDSKPKTNMVKRDKKKSKKNK